MQRASIEKSTASTLLCGPAALLYLAFFALPTLLGFAYGLTDWSGWTKDPRFIGLDNFRELLADDRFFAALRFTLFETAMIVVGYTTLSLVLAVLLDRMKVMRGLVRGLFFYPFILSILVSALLFQYLANYRTGTINTLIRAFGFDTLAQDWMGDPALVPYFILALVLWHGLGFYTTIFLAGLQTHPQGTLRSSADRRSWPFGHLLPRPSSGAHADDQDQLGYRPNHRHQPLPADLGHHPRRPRLPHVYRWLLHLLARHGKRPPRLCLGHRLCRLRLPGLGRRLASRLLPAPRDRPVKRRLPLFEIGMLLLGLLYVSPCLLALINSFKTLPEIVRSPVALPTAPTLENYHYIFTGIKLAAPMFNSFLMCAAVIATLIVVSSMAAYSLTRRRMRTGSFWRIFFLAGITVPFQILMLPLVRQFNYLGIGYTYFALWLHYVSYGLPLCLFIYSSFMRSIPRDLEEAAQIDGCTPFGTFWRVIFPLLTPCTVTIIIFWGLFTWNDFPHAFILMGTNKGELAFVQLWRFLSDKYVKNWNYIFAGVVVLSLPITILYLAMQRRFVKGLTAGSIR